MAVFKVYYIIPDPFEDTPVEYYDFVEASTPAEAEGRFEAGVPARVTRIEEARHQALAGIFDIFRPKKEEPEDPEKKKRKGIREAFRAFAPKAPPVTPTPAVPMGPVQRLPGPAEQPLIPGVPAAPAPRPKEPPRVLAPARPFEVFKRPPKAKPAAAPTPKKRKELFEVMVPPEVVKAQEVEPEAPFAIFAPPAARPAAAPGVPPEPGVPPGYRPVRRPFGPKIGWQMPTQDQMVQRILTLFHPVQRLFRDVGAWREGSDFRQEVQKGSLRGEPGRMFLDLVTQKRETLYHELSEFFDIPWDVFEYYWQIGDEQALWKDVLFPMFDLFTTAFDTLKPPDISGWFELYPDEAQKFWFVYTEPLFRRGIPG